VLRLLEGLRARGHEQELAAWPDGPLAVAARSAGFTVVGIPIRGDLDVAAAGAIAARARTFRADVVHAHTAHAHGAGMIGARIARTAVRVVTRRVVLPVGVSPWSRLKYRDPAVRYVAISGAVAAALAAGGVDPKRVRVVYSGVPVDGVPRADDPEARRAARNRLGIAEDAFTAGVVGALTREKGQETAIEAIASLPAGTRLVLVGDGPERDALAERARSLGAADRVMFAGFREDAAGLWPAFDVALAPSRHEGLGTAVLEAMAAGVPVVAAAIDAFREVLDDGAAGVLFDPGDAAGLARAAASVRGNGEMRHRVIGAGLERVKRYSIDNMVRGTESVYTDLEV